MQMQWAGHIRGTAERQLMLDLWHVQEAIREHMERL